MPERLIAANTPIAKEMLPAVHEAQFEAFRHLLMFPNSSAAE